ncbi:MAG: hypothetical protein AB1894_22345 [Chloroflexota bacterium]
MNPTIHIAFRFHGNFYHSYRGDTPDELGFGKDMRVIRHLIRTLDELNQGGIPVCGTWDFENYFSLEKIMPAHCPDIIEGLQRRAREGRDEMQLMSYNNGLISAHTAREFEAAIRRGVTNAAGSGLHDLFGDSYQPMVRPQEMMYTPIHLKLYTACGVEAISLFYSALPFNGFSNFVPALAFAERYNPLTLTYPGIEESMLLMPCYNTGDLIDHLTLRRWVKQMRKQQLALDKPQDLLLLIDMDADDEFWVGFDIPVLGRYFSTAKGLKGLVENVADLDYIEFITPGRYIKDHTPLKSICIGQDTADGSFDGLSSWAEKWSNQRLWTGLERARILELQTLRLLEGRQADTIQASLDKSFEARIKILSTTHFGMSSPVMNLRREGVGRDLVQEAVRTAAAAFDHAAEKPAAGHFSLLDYTRGGSTSLVEYQAHPSQGLVRLPLREGAPASFAVQDHTGRLLPSAVLESAGQRQLIFVVRFEPGERKDFTIKVDQSAPSPQNPVVVTDDGLQNEFLRLGFDPGGQLTSLQFEGEEHSPGHYLNSGITYAGKRCEVEAWNESESLSLGVVGLKRMQASLALPGGYTAQFERQIMLAAGLPYIFVTTRVVYPRTPDQNYDRGKALRLQQAWDGNWQTVTPCEISPNLAGTPASPLRVWKHNYCDHVSSYELDYGRFSKNDSLDSVNNQVTHAWMVISDGQRGLLVAQNADFASGMAFCPLRTRREGNILRVRLNPFGSYWGRQYHYATADTGLGRMLSVTLSAADHIKPYAPSYNGRIQEFSLLIAPYRGDRPPEALQNDAEAFAYPYLVLNDDGFIAEPPHRVWDGKGLG